MNSGANLRKRFDVCRLILVISVAIAACSVYQAIKATMGWTIVHDAPLMLYIAQKILAGNIPYRDIFDMNLPGGYFIYVFGLLIFGEGDYAFRLFDLFWMALAGLSMIYFCRKEGLLTGITSAVLFASYHLSLGNPSEGQRDFLMIPFLVMSASFMSNYAEIRQIRSLVLAGFCSGIACTVKPFVISIALLYAIFLCAFNGPRKCVRPLLSFCCGLAVFPGILAIWLLFSGGFFPLLDITSNYLLPLYRDLAPRPYPDLHLVLLQQLGIFMPLLLIPEGFRAESRNRWCLLILSVLGTSIHYFAQRKGWTYHIYPLAAFISIAAGMKVGGISKAINESEGSRVMRPACTLLIVLTLATFTSYLSLSPPRLIASNVSHVTALQNDIAANIQPGDTVQVMDTTWGAVSALYRLKLGMPSRFMYDFYLFQHVEEPYVQRMRDEFVSALHKYPPKLLVVTEFEFPTRTLGKFRTRLIPGLQEFLDQNFTVAIDRPDYIIYRKK